MKVLSHNGNEVYVGHFQGNAIKKHLDIVEEYSTKKVTISPRIAVITAFTDHDSSILALQLELSNMPYTNACTDKSSWSNIDKIKYFVETLEETTEEYSILLDGYDVLFFKDLDEGFIQKFESMNKKVIYNATKNNHPNMEIDMVDDRNSLGEFKYLNAGIVFGKTEDLLNLYKEILQITKREDIRNPWQSEQLYVRIGVSGKAYVGFDHECNLFQTFSKTSKTVCGNTVIII